MRLLPRIGRQAEKSLLWVACAILVSVILGVCDCWVAGTSRRNTLFSFTTWALSDGGTRGYLGFGYSLTYYRKLGGEHGPEIWYWFTPFTIYRTTERTGVRWLFLSRSGSEPRYQGRRLGKWISIWFSGYSGVSPHATPEEAQAAETAIKAIGTNCIPTILSWLSEDRPSINQRGTALEVFRILGPIARPAAPALVELTKNRDKEIRLYAFDSLRVIAPDKEIFVPALANLIHDPDRNLGFLAAQYLLEMDADAAEKAGVTTLFPEFK